MKIYLIFAGFLVVLIGALFLQSNMLKNIKSDRDRYKANTETLSNNVESYKTKDSLNAVTVGHLAFRDTEYQKYRAKDVELINKLQVENRSLQHVTTAQMQIIAKMQGKVRDSIIYVPVKDSSTPRVDTLKCIKVSDKWLNVDGCANKAGEFRGTFISRDSILIASTVSYKRFIGFLWKTNKVKDRKIDAVSKNPNTKIQGIEYVEIVK